MRLLCCLTAALLAAGLSARADVTSTFNVSGTFTDSTTFSGTVVVDTTTGVLESGNLSYLGLNFDVLDAQGSQPANGLYAFELGETLNTFPVLDFGFVGASLVGFNGAPLCSLDDLCNNEASSYEANSDSVLFLTTGTASPTPEPSSVALLGTGLLGFAGMVRRRLS